jgi:predicted dehydrogenase
MTANALGWGVIATGNIAGKFAGDLAHVDGARRAAVCSRSQQTADAFAAKHGFERSYSDIAGFLDDPGVEAVYVASPNTAHLEQALAVIDAGKSVVIEKPVALTARDALRIGDAASDKGVFAMEALWSRFLPAVQRAKALIENGDIGRVEHAEATLSYQRAYDPGHRLFDRALGGGVLYDLGVYPISLALFLLGDAIVASSAWEAAPNGIDTRGEMELDCGGVPVSIRTSFDSHGENTFVVFGSKGALRIDRHFVRGNAITLWNRPISRIAPSSGSFWTKLKNRLPLDGRRTERFDYPGHGLHFEARAAQAAILSGATSSAIMPIGQSARTLEIIETVLTKPARS